MIEPVRREIDGDTYEFSPLMAKAARRELDKLINKFGPAVASGIQGLQAMNVDAEVNLDAEGTEALIGALPAVANSVGSIVGRFSQSITPEYHEALITTFFEQVRVQNGENWPKLDKSYCDLHFATRLLTETKVLAFCLEVQYADFFGLLGTIKNMLGSLRKMTDQSSLNSPEDLTGTSIE